MSDITDTQGQFSSSSRISDCTRRGEKSQSHGDSVGQHASLPAGQPGQVQI